MALTKNHVCKLDFAEVWWEFFDRIPIFADTYSKWIKRLQLIKSVGNVLSCSEPSCVSRRRPSVSQVLRQIFRSLRQMEDLGRLGCDHVYQPNQAIWKYYAVVSRHFKANDAAMPQVSSFQPSSKKLAQPEDKNLRKSLHHRKRKFYITVRLPQASELVVSRYQCPLSVRYWCPLSVSCHHTAPCNRIALTVL